jgi:hypothetical protein
MAGVICQQRHVATRSQQRKPAEEASRGSQQRKPAEVALV